DVPTPSGQPLAPPPSAPRGKAPAADAPPRRTWLNLSPINRRRWRNFRANKRGFWSLIIFSALFVLSLFAEFIANDKPFVVYHAGGIYVPALTVYPETAFGGDFETEADYR